MIGTTIINNSLSSQQQTNFPSAGPTNLGGLADIFSGLGITSSVGTSSYVPTKQVTFKNLIHI
jgi:hypothetical protein